MSSSSSWETQEQIDDRVTTTKKNPTSEEFWRGHALREGRVVSSAVKQASEDTLNTEWKVQMSRKKLKGLKREAKRIAFSREMGKDSKNVTSKAISDDKWAKQARAANAEEQKDKRDARKAGLKGMPYESHLSVLEYLEAPGRKSYSDVATMRVADSRARPLEGEKTLVSTDAKTVRVEKRVIKVSSAWPPAFKVDRDTGLVEWSSRQVICNNSISLSRDGQRCVLSVADKPVGSWIVTRTTESDVKSNMLSVAMWGTADVTVKAFDKTPDAYHEGVAYDMKVRSGNPGSAVRSAVDKYSTMSSEVVRVVVYVNGRVLSNYDWSKDSASLTEVGGARGWTFVCVVSQLREMVKSFAILFGDVGVAATREVADLGNGQAYPSPGKETNDFDYVKPAHHIRMEQMARKSKDGLALEDLLLEPDDEQNQYEHITKYLEGMGKISSGENEYLDENGVFKQKLTPTPLFKYIEGYKPSSLFAPNSSVRPPAIPEQDAGTTESVIERIFNWITKTVEAGAREGASEEEKQAMMAWTTAKAEEQYAKSGAVEKMVDNAVVEELMSQIIQLEEERHTRSSDEHKARLTSIHTQIEETVLMDKEKRVKRSRRLMTSAPVRIGAESKAFESSDAVTSSFIEGPYHYRKRREGREAEQSNYALYVSGQKNLPYVEDPAFEAHMERDPGVSISPETPAGKLVTEMGTRPLGRDGNYDYLFTLDKVMQEVSASMGHSTGTGIFVKMVPHCRAIVLSRNSGKQAICTVVIDRKVHSVEDERWWVRIKKTSWWRSKFFTVNRAKACIYLNGEERHRVLCFMRSLEIGDDGLSEDEKKRSLNMFSNLACMIIASQKQPDSVILSYARYIGMILQNNCLNRGEVRALFTKVERIKTRFSLWVLRKFALWVKSREDNAVISGAKSEWGYRCWLTGYRSLSSSSRLTMFYVGNIYEKTLGERVAAIRGPFNKLLELAYHAADRKVPTGVSRVNKICEELPSYDGYFQVDWGLLRKVLDAAFEMHKRDHPNWKSEFESTLISLTRRVDGAELATRRSSFWHTSDDLVDGFQTRSKKSGRVSDTQHRVPNWNEKMQTMVVEYPNLLLGRPFTNFTNLVHPVRANVVPKKQLQGKREILILTPGARVSVASLEMVMRAFATGMDNEVLTNKNKEAKISSYASSVNYRKMGLERAEIPYRHICSRSSADATKWCQLFRMPVFAVMVKVLFGEGHKNLEAHCSAVLEEHTKKKIQIPASILREIESGSAFTEEGIRRLAREFSKDTEVHLQGECMVRIVDNMLQGILHYTSSVYHSLIQNYFTERAKESIDEALMGVALNNFAEDRKEEARALLALFNSRFERQSQREKKMYEEGRPSEDIAAELSVMRQEASDARRQLSAMLIGEAKKSKLVPSWSITYQNAASSDDTSIAIDVIVTGPSAFMRKGGDKAELVLSKLMVAKRKYYRRLGVEESASKSSVGNFKDVMEFNSKWYDGPVVVDVWLKSVMSALMAPPPTGFADMQNHYVNGRTGIIAAGGSVELVKQVRVAQAIGHQKILGCDMSDMFPFLERDIEENPHVLLGKFEYEKNSALTGLIPSFLIHYQWLDDERVRLTEQALSMSVQHDMDPSGVMSLGIRVEVGNGLRSKESMMKSQELLKKFQAGVLGGLEPKAALEEHALNFLTNSASPTARLLLELIRDTKRPIETDVSATSVYKLAILLITSPCLAVTIVNSEDAKGPGITFRMSLPSLHRLIKENKKRELLKPVEERKEVRLQDRLEESKDYSDRLMSLRVTRSLGKTQSMANRAVSSTKQVLSGVPAEIDLRQVLFRVWSGSTLDEQTMRQFSTLQAMFPDLETSIDETRKNASAYAPSRMDIVLHFMKDTNLVHNIRTRSGTALSGSGMDAMIKVLEMQSYHGNASSVSVLRSADEKEAGLSEFRFEANVRSVFRDDEELTIAFLKIRFPSMNLEAGSRDMRLLEWCRTTVAGRVGNPLLLQRASARQLVVVSEGSKGQISLVLGSAVARLMIRQNADTSVVTSVICNCNLTTLRAVLRAYNPQKKRWLSWEPCAKDLGDHNMWYHPADGVSTERHPGSIPVFTQQRIAISPNFDTVSAQTRRYGETVVQKLRVKKKDTEWDFIDVNVPVGSVVSTPAQENNLMELCAEMAVSYKCIDRYCRGETLTHEFLNDSMDRARNTWFWKWVTMRAVDLVQNGYVDKPTWDDAARAERMGKPVLPMKGAQTELIAWSPGEVTPEDLTGFEEYMSRRQRRLLRRDLTEEELMSRMDYSQALTEYHGEEEDREMVYIDYEVDEGAQLSYDAVMDEDDGLVRYMELSTTVELRAGLDVSAFARSLITLGEKPPGVDPFYAARYLLTTQPEPGEEGDEDDDGDVY